jgi:hypothetical protein
MGLRAGVEGPGEVGGVDVGVCGACLSLGTDIVTYSTVNGSP